ncbi:hypothetical protein ACN28E_22100 [Archangium lansingense]
MAKLVLRPEPISPELVALLTEHLEDMRRHSPFAHDVEDPNSVCMTRTL